MFRSYRSPYTTSVYSRRRQRATFPWKSILMTLAGLVLLELGTRAIVLFSGRSAELNARDREPATVYKIQFFNERGRNLTGLDQEGQLQIQQRALLGYQLVRDQTSPFWTISEQGFRGAEPLPVTKPEGEVRIFILGGSAAFGHWLPSNDATMPAKIEARLRERLEQQARSPEKYRPTVLPANGAARAQALSRAPRLREADYRVINAAVPGYIATNHLAQLAVKILPYQPDVIVLLSGYEDLMLAGERDAAIIPQTDKFLGRPFYHVVASLSEPVARFARGTMIFRAVRHWIWQPEPRLVDQALPLYSGRDPLEDYLPQTEAQLEQRLARYDAAVKQMVRLSAGAGVPMIVALQPEITGLDPEVLQPGEAAIAQQLDAAYVTQVQAGFTRLGELNDRIGEAFAANVKVLNYYTLFNQFSAEAFTDPVHLTEAANTALAERFYNAIAELPQLHTTPQQAPPPATVR